MVRKYHSAHSIFKAYLKWEPVKKASVSQQRSLSQEKCRQCNAAVSATHLGLGILGIPVHLQLHLVSAGSDTFTDTLLELSTAGKSHHTTTGRKIPALRMQTDYEPNRDPNLVGKILRKDRLYVEVSVSEQADWHSCIFSGADTYQNVMCRLLHCVYPSSNIHRPNQQKKLEALVEHLSLFGLPVDNTHLR